MKRKEKTSNVSITQLHSAIKTLTAEVHSQCSVIQDFQLPEEFLSSQTKANKAEKWKTKRKRKKMMVGGRKARQKDKERKRKERLSKLSITNPGRGQDEDSVIEVKNPNLSPWQKVYKLHVNYREMKKKYVRDRYKTNSSYQQAVKTRSKQEYASNLQVQEKAKTDSVSKYSNNLQWKQTVKERSKTKYKTDLTFQQAVKDQSRTKYKTDLTFQQAVKDQSRTKYRTDLTFKQAVKDQSRTKYRTDLTFQQVVKDRNRQKYRINLQFQHAVKQASIKKYASNEDFKKKIKTLSLIRYRQNVLFREKKKRSLKLKYHQDLKVRQRKVELVNETRKKRNTCASGLHIWFQKQVCDGPKYVCTACNKFKFKKQVIRCNEETYRKKGIKSLSMANQCITRNFYKKCTNECGNFCTNISHKLWICHTCHRHLLKGEMPADAYINSLQLPEIPKDLNCLNSSLKEDKRASLAPVYQFQLISKKTTNVLPRCDDETQVIRCKLKRKLEYKGHSQYEFVSTKRICKAIEELQANNPLYQDDLSINQAWVHNNPDQIDLNACEDESDASEVENDGHGTETENEAPETESTRKADTEEVIRNKGLPSDTCLQPVDIGQEVLDQHFEDIFCVAPGEGKTPVATLQEEGNEAMSFPVQFPKGVFGTYDNKRKVRITRLKYFHARLFNADSRFSSDSSYIFYAQYLSELEQVMSKVSIALRKSSGKDSAGNFITASMLTDRDQLKRLLSSDQGYKFLTPIRGTPPYWQTALRELMAMIRQLGIPTWFATFSAADMRWTEVLTVLSEQQGSSQPIEDLDWNGKAEILKHNPVMTATMFNHRFNTFLKEIILKRGVVGNVKDHFHRIEFQQRGSPHAHCLFWIDGAPHIDEDDDQAVCDFIDKYVSCALPDSTDDPDLYEKVTSVQQHSKNHSKSCKKKGTTCRFNFPRPPSEKTFISKGHSLTDPFVPGSPQEQKENAKAVLERLWKVLNGELQNDITTEALFATAGINQDAFEQATDLLTKKTTITLKRNPGDIWINQYNPELLRCWNANMDIQFITDVYQYVMYIIAYISKAEHEMGLVLDNARKEAAEGNLDAQTTMKKIGGAYFRQREVSAQEAAYRVCGLHLKESSRKVQFIPTGNDTVRMSLPLNVIRMKARQKEDDNIWMTSLYDRYKARPKTHEFENMCYATFCSEYRLLSASQVPKNPSKSGVFKLQKDMGYIQKRSRTEAAVVRYPRFSSEKYPEKHYQSVLQLFCPHRKDSQLKPDHFETYEDMYNSGAVAVSSSAEPQLVKIIVNANKMRFEKNAEALDEAQESIDKHGPLEDAWSVIAPEAERERLEAIDERRPPEDIEGTVEIPELDQSNKKGRGDGLEIRQQLLPVNQFLQMMRKLNEGQKAVFYKVRQWCLDKVNGLNPDPFHLFITGGAGTGKSHLVKCIHHESLKILLPHSPNPDDSVVILTAPTGTAAVNIGGTTLHQAFSLSTSLQLPYIYKRDDELNKLRTKLQNLQILIIDEISMVSQIVLLYVSERLRQIKQSGNAIFGNICVIAVGDFYQIPPVMQKSLFDLRHEKYFSLWSDNFSIVELIDIMRQKDDKEFAQMLNRLRVKKKSEKLSENDLEMLLSCTNHTVPPETLHIVSTLNEVNTHNTALISQVCDSTETLLAKDFDKNPQTGKMIAREVPNETTRDYLPSELTLGPQARVILMRNVDVAKGLVNGLFGTVVELASRDPETSVPQAVMIMFDKNNIGAEPSNHLPIKITRYEEKLKNNSLRHQFPIQLAWACTTHKVQGVTTDKAVVSLKKTFAPGMAYVALSRVTSMDGLVLKDFDEDKIYCNEHVTEALQRMPKFLSMKKNVFKTTFTIALHNVQGLVPHIEDIRCNTDLANVDVVGMTETWLGKKSVPPSLKNYRFFSQARHSSYSSDSQLFKQLKNKKHGGVGIYVKENMASDRIPLNTVNMECIGLFMKNMKTKIVVIYRPETYIISVFLKELDKLINIIRKEDTPTLILGDFNQDLSKSESSIKNFMDQKGFKQLVQASTTDGNTVIDHVYLYGDINIQTEVIQTYYSYHNLVKLNMGN